MNDEYDHCVIENGGHRRTRKGKSARFEVSILENGWNSVIGLEQFDLFMLKQHLFSGAFISTVSERCNSEAHKRQKANECMSISFSLFQRSTHEKVMQFRFYPNILVMVTGLF